MFSSYVLGFDLFVYYLNKISQIYRRFFIINSLENLFSMLKTNKKARLFLLGFFLCSGYWVSAQNVQAIKYPALERLIKSSNNTVLVVNFWATWCKPCVEELPHFEKLNAKYADKNVKVVLINLDAAADLNIKVKPFVAKNNIQSSTYLLDEPDYNTWIDLVSADWSGSLPFTLIVGADNKTRKIFEEPLTETQLEIALKPFLN